MFSHRYESSSPADPDFPGPIVVSVEALDGVVFKALPDYLCENLHLRYDLTGVDTHLQGRPLVVEIGGTCRLSERAIWHLLVDDSSGAKQVCNYVEAVLGFTSADEDIGFYSYLDVIGQDPLYAYIERFAVPNLHDETQESEQFLEIADVFLRFLRRCDMDHETYQGKYISQMLLRLKSTSRERLVDLLIFRWTHGQETELNTEQIEYLYSRGMLKDVIDRIISIESPTANLLYSDLVKLCRSVYGNDVQATSEVLDYCLSNGKIVKGKLNKYDEKDLAWIDDYSRFRLNLYEGELNTGFHRYDQSSGEWSTC